MKHILSPMGFHNASGNGTQLPAAAGQLPQQASKYDVVIALVVCLGTTAIVWMVFYHLLWPLFVRTMRDRRTGQDHELVR
jgi:hypothetical protein